MDPSAHLSTRQKLRELLDPVIERLGFRLSAIEMANDGRHNVVRLFIDGPGGVGVDDCARVSREISPVLDVDDPIPGAYNLEVSSPGFDRLIELEDDYRRFAGFRVKLKMAPGPERLRYTGILKGIDEEGMVLIEVDGQLHRLPRAGVATARLSPTPEDDERLREISRGPMGTGESP